MDFLKEKFQISGKQEKEDVTVLNRSGRVLGNILYI